MKHTFPGLFIIQLVLRGGQNQQIIKTTFHQIVSKVATKGVGTRGRPTSPLHLGVSNAEQILKEARKNKKSQSSPALCSLDQIDLFSPFSLTKEENKIHHG